MQARKRSGTRSAANSTSKLPERLTFFLDESLDSGSIVTALRVVVETRWRNARLRERRPNAP